MEDALARRVTWPSGSHPAVGLAKRVLCAAGRLSRTLMVLACAVATVFILVVACGESLYRSTASRGQPQPTTGEKEAKLQPDGTLFFQQRDFRADTIAVYDTESKLVWEGKSNAAPPFHFLEFPAMVNPARVEGGAIPGWQLWSGSSSGAGFGQRPTVVLSVGSPSGSGGRGVRVVWRYSRYAQVWERFDREGRCQGALGATGFVENSAAATPFGPVLAALPDADVPQKGPVTRCFWITADRVYRLDFTASTVEVAIAGEPLQHLCVSVGLYARNHRVRCQVITAEGVHHLWLVDPREYRRIAVRTADGRPLVGAATIGVGGQVYLKETALPARWPGTPEDSTARCFAALYRVSAEGVAEEISRHTWENPAKPPLAPLAFVPYEWPIALWPGLLYMTPLRRPQGQPSLSAAMSPPGHRLLLGEALHLATWFGRPSCLTATALVSAAWLVLGIALARRRGESWGAIAGWLPVVLAFNLAGFLTWRLCAEQPVRACARCGRRTAAARQVCQRCGGSAAAEQELRLGASPEARP